MMNSYRPNERRRARGPLVIATALVLLILLFDFFSGGLVRHAVRGAADALWSVGAAALGKVGGSGFFASHAALVSENAALEQEVAKLRQQAASYGAAESENAQLREFMHLASSLQGITAPVISPFLSSPYGSFTIGAGTDSGVRNGDLVFTADGFVVGKISDVSAHSALVTEIFAPGQDTPVVVNGLALVLHGEGGGNASGQAPRGTVVATGTPAVAPSLKARPVGVVGSTEGGESSASTQILVRIPASLDALTYVYVEIGH